MHYPPEDYPIGTRVRCTAGEQKNENGTVMFARKSELSGDTILLIVYDCGCVDDTALPEVHEIIAAPEHPFPIPEGHIIDVIMIPPEPTTFDEKLEDMMRRTGMIN